MLSQRIQQSTRDALIRQNAIIGTLWLAPHLPVRGTLIHLEIVQKASPSHLHKLTEQTRGWAPANCRVGHPATHACIVNALLPTYQASHRRHNVEFCLKWSSFPDELSGRSLGTHPPVTVYLPGTLQPEADMLWPECTCMHTPRSEYAL